MIENFKDLTKPEVRSLGRFIRSPFLNFNKSLIKLFDYLSSAYPDITDDYTSKSNLSINVYKEKRVNDAKIRKLISDFQIIIEEYFMMTERESDDIGNRIFLLRSLMKKNLKKRFESNMKELLKTQAAGFVRDSVYYRNQINISEINYNYNNNKYKTEFAEVLQDISDLTDYDFMFQKLHLFREMSINESGKGKKFNKNFIDEIIAHIEKNRESISKEHPNLYIIYLVTMMDSTLDDKYLDLLMQYMKKHGKKFETETLKIYYGYIKSYYINKINKGETGYRKKAFELITYLEKKKLFMFNDVMEENDYNSVINIVLPLKEFAWLEKFIDAYKQFLPEENYDDAYNLAKAKLLYQQKEYQNTFEHLNKVSFKNPYYYMHSKFLLGRVHFEMNNIDSCKYIVQNLKQYLRMKNILIPEQIIAIKNFNIYISDLIKICETAPKNITEVIVLKKSLDNEKTIVPDKNWFYEKIKAVSK